MRVIFDIEITQIPRTSQFFDLYQFIRELSILSRMKWVNQIPSVSHPPDRENRVPHEAVPVGFVVKYPALNALAILTVLFRDQTVSLFWEVYQKKASRSDDPTI